MFSHFHCLMIFLGCCGPSLRLSRAAAFRLCVETLDPNGLRHGFVAPVACWYQVCGIVIHAGRPFPVRLGLGSCTSLWPGVSLLSPAWLPVWVGAVWSSGGKLFAITRIGGVSESFAFLVSGVTRRDSYVAP